MTTEDTSSHLTLMMMTEMDIETSVYYVHLTRLIAWEDFIKFTRCESTKTYMMHLSVSHMFCPWNPFGLKKYCLNPKSEVKTDRERIEMKVGCLGLLREIYLLLLQILHILGVILWMKELKKERDVRRILYCIHPCQCEMFWIWLF